MSTMNPASAKPFNPSRPSIQFPKIRSKCPKKVTHKKLKTTLLLANF